VFVSEKKKQQQHIKAKKKKWILTETYERNTLSPHFVGSGIISYILGKESVNGDG